MRTAIALLAGIVFTACCPKPPPPEPASGCPPGSAPLTKTQLDACLHGVVFDTSYGASDEQPLAVISPTQGQPCPGDATGTRRCRYGPLAKIEPAIGAHRYSDSDLREGRIIARLSIPAGEKEGYPKYGLTPGDATYWWVRTDSDSTGVSFFLTLKKDGSVDTLSRPLRREPDATAYKGKVPGGTKWRRDYARWIWSLKDEEAKGRCGSGGCS